MIVLSLFAAAVLVTMLIILISNILFFPKLTAVNDYKKNKWPSISIMIPARNEQLAIADTLQRLIDQDYPNFEIVVLDDQSIDETLSQAQAVAATVGNVHAIQGQPLPDNWLGKNWACYQMAQLANGDLFLFTDADVKWERGALRSVVAQFNQESADVLSIWPIQITETWGERLCIPLMAMVILSYLPVLAVHHTQWSSFAAANGQSMVWKRSAYEQLGGHSAVKANVLEDVALARMVKSAGMRLRIADANHFLYCRMYKSWPEVRDGYAKNILAGYGGRIALLVLATLFHWLLFIFPWFWLTTAALKTDDHQLMAATALIVLGIAIRGVSAVYTHQRAGDALFMPLSVLLMTRIALQAIWWHYKQGGPSWKGRKLHTTSKSRSTNEYL